MMKRISAIKMRQNLGQVMNEVALREDEYIVERAGKPLVAIIPVARYQAMVEERQEFFRMAAEMRKASAGADEEVIDRDIAEALSAHRQTDPKP